MIARLKGVLEEIQQGVVILDVHSVGYELRVSDRLSLPPVGTEVTLEVYTHVREDAMELYGFLSLLERKLFAFLISASGVGPRLALSILSHSEGEKLVEAIRQGHLQTLTAIPGIGRKKAEKLLLELREKCDKQFPRTSYMNSNECKNFSWESDLMEALVGLGYRDLEVRRVVKQVLGEEPTDFESALKMCLQQAGRSATFVGTV